MMRKLKSRSVVCFVLLPFLIAALAVTSSAAGAGTVRGRVLDPLGAAVQNARVILLEDETVLRDTHTDREGKFQFSSVNAGRYRVRVEAGGFVTQESPASFLPGGAEAVINIKVALQIGPLRQQIVVSDTGTALPKSEVGASVSVIDGVELRDLHKLDVLDALRLVPGVEVAQTGQRGGTTDVFVRGGEADFNKVLIDGIPANDIGGAF
jgi:iron complex outermembrane receptor protein/vitamin B12 transporter